MACPLPPRSEFDYQVVDAYKWIGLLAHNFQLEAMVFISGLLFGYTLELQPERLSFNSCVIKKVKRILLPSLFFSIMYYLLFYDLHAPFGVILQKLLNGCGHLWFLPMLFWCFVICYILERLHINPFVILLMSLIALLIPVNIPYLGLGRLHQFFFFFYLGVAIKKKYIIFPKVQNNRILCCLLIIYIILCTFNEMIISSWWKPMDFVGLSARALITRTTHTLCALSMIVFLYNLANRTPIKNFLNNCPNLITLSGYCYGVYIYQQFILQGLYYHTSFTSYVSLTVFPWIGFIITLILSLILCHLTLKTKIGRYLIG